MERAICQRVHDLLPTINENYAALLRRVDLDEASIADVAAETGMSPNNVPVKLHRARSCGATLWPIGAIAVLIVGCGGGNTQDSLKTDVRMAPIAQMPLEVQRAPVSVQEAYQFVTANVDALRQMPCYCGCGAMGHTSITACYVSDSAAGNATSFDAHALGCSICVDIARDAMRLMQQGSDVAAIRGYVDASYARYGPSNIR